MVTRSGCDGFIGEGGKTVAAGGNGDADVAERGTFEAKTGRLFMDGTPDRAQFLERPGLELLDAGSGRECRHENRISQKCLGGFAAEAAGLRQGGGGISQARQLVQDRGLVLEFGEGRQDLVVFILSRPFFSPASLSAGSRSPRVA